MARTQLETKKTQAPSLSPFRIRPGRSRLRDRPVTLPRLHACIVGWTKALCRGFRYYRRQQPSALHGIQGLLPSINPWSGRGHHYSVISLISALHLVASGAFRDMRAPRPELRMYIDETGSHSACSSEHSLERYLGVTGAIIRLDHARDRIAPEIEAIKRNFCRVHHPDRRVPLHRKEIISGLYPWDCDGDQDKRQQLTNALVALIRETEMVVVSVTIDKYRMGVQYTSPEHSYQYALECLMERYVKHLQSCGLRGDMMAESRGKSADRALAQAYRRLFERGCAFVTAREITASLSSNEIKIQSKKMCVPGLELADLLAKPALIATLRDLGTPDRAREFDKEAIALLEASKFRRSGNGKIVGWGRVHKP